MGKRLRKADLTPLQDSDFHWKRPIDFRCARTVWPVLGPERNVWYWHPNRAGIQLAPSWFLTQLHALGPELSATWNPVTERWQLWSASPRFQHPICQGWRLLFVHHDAQGGYLPLDERIFARLYSASAQVYGSAKGYFEHVANEMERDRAKQARQDHQDQLDMAMPYFEHAQIKNIGKGSKFATYHSGL